MGFLHFAVQWIVSSLYKKLDNAQPSACPQVRGAR